MTPAELLRCLLERAGKNPTSLARAIDANDRRLQPALSRFLHGRATPNSIKPAADYFDIDVSVFASERAATDAARRLGFIGGDFGDTPAEQPQRPPPPEARVPVVGTAQLGDNGYFCELEYAVGFGDGWIQWISTDPNVYAVRCRGESMKPRIRHGEFVIVEPGKPVNPGDEVLVKVTDGRVMVKTFAFERDGLMHFDSINETHPRISLPNADVTSMHYVAGIAKSTLWHQS